MRRWNHVMLAMCMAAAATACGGDRDANTTDAERPPAVGTSGATADPVAGSEAARMAGTADRDFVGDMMADGQAEIELGKLAQQKARNKQVKDFAAMMVRDHTKAAAELKTAATHANFDMASASTKAGMDDHSDLRERLSKLSGAEFDREYMKAMVDEHEEAVNDVEDKASDAENDHVKSWAAKTLPTLKNHLEQARQIHESLDKQSGN